MCLGTTRYIACSHDPVSSCLPGPTHCVPCFPSRDEEINKLKHCLENLKKSVNAVEERLSLLNKEK